MSTPTRCDEMPVTVVKVGGSLIGLPSFPQNLNAWIAARPSERRYYLVGGGKLVDQLRKTNELVQMTEDFCHWSALRLMSEMALWFQSSVLNLPIVDSQEAVSKKLELATDVVLDCQEFMKHQSLLPRDWSTTSDSIAAELATKLRATELCVLKATLPKTTCIRQWAEHGIVDSNFPNFAKPLSRVTLFDLHDDRLLSVVGT